MDKVKLDLKGMSAGDKARFATMIGEKLIANETTFPEPPVAGADLMDFANSITQAITDAHTARLAWRDAVNAQNALVATLEDYLRRTGNYVENVSAGNGEIIELAGLSVRNPKAPVGPLRALKGFTAAASRNPGSVDLMWTRQKGAMSYIVQYMASERMPETFEKTEISTRTKFTITKLTSATRYYFRAAALGAAGPSPWSNAVSVVTQ